MKSQAMDGRSDVHELEVFSAAEWLDGAAIRDDRKVVVESQARELLATELSAMDGGFGGRSGGPQPEVVSPAPWPANAAIMDDRIHLQNLQATALNLAQFVRQRSDREDP